MLNKKSIFFILKIISERTTLAKTLVQSAINDAFRKESVTIQLARCWPLLLTELIND
jgi:hypothetical protein